MIAFPGSMRFHGLFRSTRGTVRQFIGRTTGAPKLIADGTLDRIEGRILRLVATARPTLRLVNKPFNSRETSS